MAELSEFDEELGDEALQLFVAWLTGDRLTDRADEAERRWRAAQEWREESPPELGVIDRFLALSNLALPAGHRERDGAFAMSLLENHLARSLDAEDVGEAIRAVADLFSSDLVSEERGEELLELGEELSRPPTRRAGKSYLLAAEHFSRGRFIAARDAGRVEDAEYWMERARLYSGLDSGDETLDLSKLASLATQYHMAGDNANAADCYRRIVEETGLDDYVPVQEFSLQEAVLRLGLGDYERAAEVLTQLLPLVEARYLTAVLDEDVADAEQRLVETVDALARAEAERGRWDEVVRTLDRSSGLRLRYRAALRERGDTASIMALERELDAAMRGAAPSEGEEDEQALSARARLLEEYRRLRAALPADRMDSPAIADLAGVLAPTRHSPWWRRPTSPC